jgi:hypothetical protein
MEREERLDPLDQLDPDLNDPRVRRLLDAERVSDLYVVGVDDNGNVERERFVQDPRELARRPPADDAA